MGKQKALQALEAPDGSGVPAGPRGEACCAEPEPAERGRREARAVVLGGGVQCGACGAGASLCLQPHRSGGACAQSRTGSLWKWPPLGGVLCVAAPPRRPGRQLLQDRPGHEAVTPAHCTGLSPASASRAGAAAASGELGSAGQAGWAWTSVTLFLETGSPPCPEPAELPWGPVAEACHLQACVFLGAHLGLDRRGPGSRTFVGSQAL